jgi:chromosome segregation ATPase
LADEATIKKLETMLQRKIKELDEKNNDFEQAAHKIQVTEEELNFLRNEVENERRKSTVDQNRVKKMEQLIAEKERKLEDAQEAFLRRDSDIRMLEKAIEDERRKSMLDEQRLRQLEKELEARVDEAGANYEKYIAAQQHYELSSDEIERLKQELERERRTTMAENDYAARKIQQMERENQELKEKAHRGKSDLNNFKG